MLSLDQSTNQPLRFSGSQFQIAPRDAANQSTISAGKVSHRGTLNTSQVVVRADDTRDRIIGMYKDEIKSHSARERDFVHLQDLIADLERKTRLL